VRVKAAVGIFADARLGAYDVGRSGDGGICKAEPAFDGGGFADVGLFVDDLASGLAPIGMRAQNRPLSATTSVRPRELDEKR
jgi:hypothetical protein